MSWLVGGFVVGIHGADTWALGLSHHFSKRTEVYAIYTTMDNDDDSSWNLNRGSGSSPSGGAVTGEDVDPPATSVSPAGAVFEGAQRVSLRCDDRGGSGCQGTYYTLDGYNYLGPGGYVLPTEEVGTPSLQWD